jgi:hypothetical protein
MSKNEIEDLKAMFSDGSGFGDPDARRNAELRLQTLLVERQDRTASQLNRLTLLLVIAAFLNAVLLAIQILTK